MESATLERDLYGELLSGRCDLLLADEHVDPDPAWSSDCRVRGVVGSHASRFKSHSLCIWRDTERFHALHFPDDYGR